MNERVKELIEQATSYMPGRPPYEGLTFDVFNKEKFAELIVRECAVIAKHHVMNISTYADAEFVEKQIQEHFGVEE